MTAEKRINPYQRLLEQAREYAAEVDYPTRVQMWHYPKAHLAEAWALTDLDERTRAAKQLGFDVMLKPTDAGLEVWYVQKRPERPYLLA